MSGLDPALLQLWTGLARPEWVDYNGHLMDGYYLVAFTEATEAFLAHVGFGPAYLEKTGCTIYTAEAHVNFLREVKGGGPLVYYTQLLGWDAKRLHLFHHMLAGEARYLAATNEVMLLHVDQAGGPRVTPMPAEQLARLQALAQAQAALPRPAQAGRSIGLAARPRA